MDWTGSFQVTQKAPGISGCLVAIYGNEDPTGGPFDRHKETSSRRLMGYLWQVFYINVHESGIIRLEATVLGFVILGFEITKKSHYMPAQATI
tara:strand:- start:913 stop:1191 length:279 start_codon:yes stop_codon:yes gene_type:complete